MRSWKSLAFALVSSLIRLGTWHLEENYVKQLVSETLSDDIF